MNSTGLSVVGALLLVGIVFWYWRARRCMTRASNHVAEHEVIRKQIKVTDDKVLDLEIRVRVLEDK